eukprot:GEZU01022926.1.p1 GENE.GEZU01022926.1~~GEZU01022926.1.p1  ORF type:complete len:811 (-),score=173.29 GEZU01022926.1:61-2493(-)
MTTHAASPRKHPHLHPRGFPAATTTSGGRNNSKMSSIRAYTPPPHLIILLLLSSFYNYLFEFAIFFISYYILRIHRRNGILKKQQAAAKSEVTGLQIHTLTTTKNFEALASRILANSNHDNKFRTADVLIAALHEAISLLEEDQFKNNNDAELVTIARQVRSKASELIQELEFIRAKYSQHRRIMKQENCNLTADNTRNELLEQLCDFEDSFRGFFQTILHEVDYLYDSILSIQQQQQRSNSFLSLFGSGKTNTASARDALRSHLSKLATLHVLTARGCEIIRQTTLLDTSTLSTILYDVHFDVTPELRREINIFEFIRHPGRQFIAKARLFYGFLCGMTATVFRTIDLCASTLIRNILFCFYNVYYFFNKTAAAHACVEFYNRGANINSCRALWNMKHDSLLVTAYSLFFIATVRVSKLMHIDLKKKKGVNNCSVNTGNNKSTQPPTSVLNRVDGQVSMEQFQRCSDMLEHWDSSHKSLQAERKVRMRIISAYDNLETFFSVHEACQIVNEVERAGEKLLIRLRSYYDHWSLGSSNRASARRAAAYTTPTSPSSSRRTTTTSTSKGCLLLHVHGGGFIAMDTFSHENYVRVWARDLAIPVVSVEYTMAPEGKFPAALEECFAVYKWVLEHGHEIVGSPLRKIILVGDSAGGNLCAGITLKAIAEGLRIPDALALIYPVLHFSESPSPSRLLAFLDPMVTYGFLKVCADSYISDCHDHLSNPFISPAIAPDEVLRQFPPTLISTGSLDPLLDDSLFMARRLAKVSPNKVRLEIWDGLSHGFLSIFEFVPFDDVTGPCTDSITRWFRNFVN